MTFIISTVQGCGCIFEKNTHTLLWGSGLGDAAASKNVQLGRLLKSLVELNGGWWWVKALLAPGEVKVLTRGIIL